MDIRIRPVSLTLFTTIFIALFLILLFSLGRLTYLEVEKLNSSFQFANQQQADDEVDAAIEESLKIISKKTEQLAKWEELTQQLLDPTYYTYWYRHRAKDNRFLSEYILDLALYDSNGDVLSHINTSLLPDHIEPIQNGQYIYISEYEPFVTAIKPIKNKNSEQILGYIATLNRLIPIVVTRHFSWVDQATLSVKTEQAERITTEAFKNHLHYQLISAPYTQAVQSEMTDFLLRLATITAILTLLIFPLAAWMISRPIMKITEHLNQLKSHPYDPVVFNNHDQLLITELDNIRESLNSYHNQLNQVNTSLDQKTQELQNLTHQDSLTGVMNRSAFDDFWQEVCHLFKNSNSQTCLIIFDINHFKALNDTYGHQAGDAVLIAISSLINNILRNRQQLFRLGGDEFATVLIGCNHRKAMQLAKQCHIAISNYPFEKHGIMEPVRMSIGVAHTAPGDDSSLDSLQWQADVAVHFAKRPGYSNIVSFSAELAKHAQGLYSNRTHSVVFEAISNGNGLVLHYQPIVDLDNNKPEYYEVLMRIMHDGQLIMPSHIFPLVEARRLEHDMDRQIIRKIIADLEARKIPPGTGVSINLSAPSIVDSELPTWLEDFVPFMSDYKLLIEVTETALITQLETARKNLKRLRSMGFRVALDDFGSGYSSLRYLGAMPVDVVKFDITLTQLIENEDANPILNHLAQMITESGYILVAEGIESETAAEQLKQLGFHYGQGFYFGKPSASLSQRADDNSPVNFSA
ncbi:MAG: bifunctional diguanylate cyclase/phosphodiesterase [Candidatus Thiodiazotropha sp. 6PLUC9]